MIVYTQEVSPGHVANRKAFVAMEESQTAVRHIGHSVEGTVREVEDVEAVPQSGAAASMIVTQEGRPDPEWVRGRCPECGDDLVSNMYYVGRQGYLMVWECWGARGRERALLLPACALRQGTLEEKGRITWRRP